MMAGTRVACVGSARRHEPHSAVKVFLPGKHPCQKALDPAKDAIGTVL